VTEPVTVGVWEYVGAEWSLVREVRTWSTLNLEPRFNKPGPWSMSMPWNAQAATLSKRNLVTFDFRGTRVTGVVENYGASSDENGQPRLDVSGLDALTLLSDALGWASPTKEIDEQTEVRYYQTGAAETVLRDFIQVNLVDRLGYDIKFPAASGRGAAVEVNSAFSNVLAVVTDAATLGGIGVRCGLVNTTSATKAALTVEFYEPRDLSTRIRLSQKVGTLRTWKQSDTVPTGTRAIIEAAKEKEGHDVASVDVAANSITTAGNRKTKGTRDVASVDVSGNSVTTKNAHNFGRGDRISFTSGNAPGPLSSDTDYYAIRVDANTFKVSLTKKDAQGGHAVDLNNNGGGDLKVSRITIQNVDNKLRTGDIVTFTGGVPPSPLESGVGYHAIRIDDNTFKLAMTRPDARDGDNIDLTDAGSGSMSVTEETIRYRQVIMDDRELVWGRVRETLVTGSGEDKNGALDDQARESLQDSGEQSVFEIETTESTGMRYGAHYGIGDTVLIELSAKTPDGADLEIVSRTERVGAVKVTATPEQGLTLQVVPGDPDATSPLFQLAAIIRGLRRRVNQVQED
jgi:hypothetical protein